MKKRAFRTTVSSYSPIVLILLMSLLLLPAYSAASSIPVADFTGGPLEGCSPVTVTFTNNSTGGDGPLSFKWEFTDTFMTNNSSTTVENPVKTLYHYDGTAPYYYVNVKLTVTDADGDSSVMYKADYVKIYNSRLMGPPRRCSNVTPSFTASPTTGDAPLTVNFTNTTTGYTPPFSYEWDFDNDGVVDSTETNPSHTYNSVGWYTVKLKATDPYSRTGTEIKTNHIFVKIGSVPTADFTGTPTSGNNPLTVNFTNNTTGGDAPLSYEWDFNNDGVVDSTAFNPSHVYTSSGSYTVKLKVTDTHGDTDTVTKQNYVVVTTGSVPVADFTGAPTTGCSPVTVAFTNKSTGGDAPLSYKWEFENYGGILTNTEANPTTNFYNEDSGGIVYYGVRLTVTDADGDISVMYKANYVAVNGYLVIPGFAVCRNITAGFTASPTTGDAPLTVNFTNTTTGYTPPFSYEWDFDNDGVVDSTETNPSHTYNSVGWYTVKLKATDPYSRTGTEIKTNHIFVKIGSVPTADFTGTPTSGNNPLTVNFTNNTIGGDAPLSYEWDFNNDGVVDSTAFNPSHVYTSSGSYTVKLKVTDTHGDTNTVTKQNYVVVTTGSVPVADFTGGPLEGCTPATVTFTNSSTGGDQPLSYRWEFSDMFGINNSSTAEENPVATFYQEGTSNYDFVNVKLTVTDADGDSSVMYKAGYVKIYNSRLMGPPRRCSNVTPSFTASATTGDAPLTVNFTNTTTGFTPPFSYEWDFDNDGVVDSTEANPSHTYNSIGLYTVKLKATDPYGRTGTATDYIIVHAVGDISAGSEHTLLIKPDGTLWAWGRNDSGQLGNSTTVDSFASLRIGTGSDWMAVSAGWKHSIAIKEDGTLWAWGDNDYSQLGDGTTTDRYAPVQIGSASDWVAIAAGGAHNLAIKANGTLWSWGGNFKGQLGDGTTTTRTSPVQIGSDTNWTSITAGWEHSAAIKSDRSLYTWGWNEKGQLGDGTTTDRYTPVKVVGLTGVAAIAGGGNHTIALKNDGTVWAWGVNWYGQLGDGTTIDSYTPVQVVGLTDVAAIASGWDHSIALKNEGTVWAWGNNWYGQLGNGTTTDSDTPVQVLGLTDVAAISGGGYHSIALKNDETVWAWGVNWYGQLGNGTTTDSSTPFQVVGLIKLTFEENDPAISYTGTWNTKSCPSCSGGALKYSKHKNAYFSGKAVFSFNGTGIKWIVAKANNLGKAKVYLDGVYIRLVDLYSAAPQYQVVLQKSGLAPGAHTVTIEVSGQKNPSSTGTYIDLDAFEVIP